MKSFHVEMFRFLAYLMLLAFCTSLSLAQAPDTLWTKTYGGTLREDAWEVQQTVDGGYIIVGETESFTSAQVHAWLLKTDSLGDTLWTRTYGGQNSTRGYSVQKTTDGGYVFVGYIVYYGSTPADVYLVKTDSLGDTLWTRTYGGTHDEKGRSVKQTSDGGYIIAGTKRAGSYYDDVFIIKTNSSGDTVWTKTYGVTFNDQAFSVHQLADDGYMVAAYTYHYCGGGIWFIRMDSTGDTLWTKVYNHPVGVAGKSCRPTSEGGYIATGVNYNGDIWLIKLDSLGDSLWTQSHGQWPTEDWGFDVLETAGQRYVLTGKTGSWGANPEYDVFLIKTDSLGNRLYTQLYDRDIEDIGRSLQQTADSGFIIVGRTTANNFDIYLIKTGTYPGIDEQTTIAIKHCRQGTTIFSGPLQLSADKKCKVFDITGRVVESYKMRPGIYFVEIDGVVTQKVVKVR
jgi:hypothetical protein